MIETLKEIILDFQEEVKETGTERHLEYEIINNKVFICIGVRRCGKTTLLLQIAEKIEKKGAILPENIIYINFFDDRLTELKNGNLQPVLDAYYSLYPEEKKNTLLCFFFDEIQEVTGWEIFVERLRRTKKCLIFLTGSSARMLSKEISTQMRGRAVTWELFPFSFKEYLDYKKCSYTKISSKNRYLIKSNFDKYFQFGGFPEVFDKGSKITLMIHQEYFKSIIHRDIIERHDAGHPQAVMKIAWKLLTSVSNLFTINKLTEYVKSFGFKVPKSFVSDCLDWFEDSYFLFPLKIFSRSLNVQNTNPKKIYCIDHGLVRSILPDASDREGYLLENIMFMHLRVKGCEIYYYKTKSGREIDFLLVKNNKEKKLLQVCYKIKNDETLNREIKSLFEGMNELNIDSSYIVTMEDERVIKSEGKIISIIPAWRFLTGEYL